MIIDNQSIQELDFIRDRLNRCNIPPNDEIKIILYDKHDLLDEYQGMNIDNLYLTLERLRKEYIKPKSNRHIWETDVAFLKSIKQKYGIQKMVIHYHIDMILDKRCPTIAGYPYWEYLKLLIELDKNIKVKISEPIFHDEYSSGYLPVVSDFGFYLIEHPNDGNEILNEMVRFKTQYLSTLSKFNNDKFVKNAPIDVLYNEFNKYHSFLRKWKYASIGFLYV